MWRVKTDWRKRQVVLAEDAGDGEKSAVQLVVGLDGYDYKHYTRKGNSWGRSTRGQNIHLSMNGPASFTFDQFEKFLEKMQAEVDYARLTLESEERADLDGDES